MTMTRPEELMMARALGAKLRRLDPESTAAFEYLTIYQYRTLKAFGGVDSPAFYAAWERIMRDAEAASDAAPHDPLPDGTAPDESEYGDMPATVYRVDVFDEADRYWLSVTVRARTAGEAARIVRNREPRRNLSLVVGAP